jgi:hypothetical protein
MLTATATISPKRYTAIITKKITMASTTRIGEHIMILMESNHSPVLLKASIFMTANYTGFDMSWIN